jgi:HPt (histidine-containing phosphotransfer) domain-containing protein
MFERFGQISLLDDAQLELLREALDEDELRAMLSELPEAARQAIDAIETSVAANDLDQARRSAHVLKGVASSFGAARLAAIAREIELELPSIASVATCVPWLIETVEQTAAAFPGSAMQSVDVASRATRSTNRSINSTAE